MNLSDLTPLLSVEDLEAETRGDDPWLKYAHRDVPLSDEGEMCDACPYCREVCGDGKVEE